MGTERLERVSERIKQEVAQILQQELKDPRVGFVTVTRVKITPDLRHATVYYSLLEQKGKSSETESGLKSAAGYIRRILGSRLEIKVTPEVRFRLDPSIAENIRISKLLSDIKKPEESI